MVEVWRHKPGSSAERVLTARLRSDRTGIGEGFDFDYHLTIRQLRVRSLARFAIRFGRRVVNGGKWDGFSRFD
jgi:hypothetical protein